MDLYQRFIVLGSRFFDIFEAKDIRRAVSPENHLLHAILTYAVCRRYIQVVAANTTTSIAPATQTPVRIVPHYQPSRVMARMASMT